MSRTEFCPSRMLEGFGGSDRPSAHPCPLGPRFSAWPQSRPGGPSVAPEARSCLWGQHAHHRSWSF